MQTIAELIAASRAFAGLERRHLDLIAGCGANTHFAAGEYLCRTGDPADRFYLIRRGSVTLDLIAGGRQLTIETLHEDEIAGFSWLFEPYRWMFDARAVADTSVVAFDAVCLRGKCDADHELGYQLMRRMTALAVTRLQATRLQLLDVYAAPAR
ncbi:MAG TPA: cyclic nucleotide-binding domain-containing protein [Solirubrobacteraceae bacterium]|nr:cyclic nucleotide-binding domain-containing protein [Solirubrobacteraceae bacterium]